jgi:hypothetical protein
MLGPGANLSLKAAPSSQTHRPSTYLAVAVPAFPIECPHEAMKRAAIIKVKGIKSLRPFILSPLAFWARAVFRAPFLRGKMLSYIFSPLNL